MYWHQTALMLENKQFQRLTCNHEEINFYCKTEDENAYIITLVDTTKRYYYEAGSLITLKDELERKFLLRGSKNVEVIFILYVNNLTFYKNALDSGLNMWLVDVESRRLLVYENQPDDFIGLKGDIEESLKLKQPAKRIQYPFVTIGLVLANIAVFIFMYIISTDPIYYTELGANNWTQIFLSHEVYRLFTCMFIHSGSDHLINNMLSLAIIGNETEKKLGHIHFSVLYLVSGLLSSLASALYHMYEASQTGVLVISIGASGAVFGVYGAYLFITLLRNKKLGMPISIYRVALITLLLLSNCFSEENIDNVAHLAGLIIGIIISFIYCKCDKSILKY